MLNTGTINYKQYCRERFLKNPCMNNANNIQFKTPFLLNAPVRDTVSFSGKKSCMDKPPSGEDFLEKYKKAGIIIGDFVRLARDEGEFLGDSWTAKVYTIPVNGMEKYCLKIPKPFKNEGTISLIEDRFPGENYGQPVAKIADCKVLLKVNGKPCGIPQWKENLTRPEIEKIYVESLKEAAGMPQKAYDDLARKLHKIRYLFDHHSNNVLMDLKKKEFNVVDVDTKELEPATSFVKMADALVDSYRVRKFGLYDEKYIELRKIILNKCITASKNTRCLYPTDKNEEWILETFEICGMKGKWGKVSRMLRKAIFKE